MKELYQDPFEACSEEVEIKIDDTHGNLDIDTIKGSFIGSSDGRIVFNPIHLDSIKRFAICFISDRIRFLVEREDNREDDREVIHGKISHIKWIDEDGIVIKTEDRDYNLDDNCNIDYMKEEKVSYDLEEQKEYNLKEEESKFDLEEEKYRLI